jgi:predicted nucleic acid-binding protein
MSADSYFLDTNIFVYSFDPREPQKATVAEKLITRAVISGLGAVSYQVVQEFLNVGLRKFGTVMTAAEVERYFFRIFLPLMKISSSTNLFLEALHLQSSRQLAWSDALIVAAALQGGCKILYSEDFPHGQRFGDLVVENPFR